MIHNWQLSDENVQALERFAFQEANACNFVLASFVFDSLCRATTNPDYRLHSAVFARHAGQFQLSLSLFLEVEEALKNDFRFHMEYGICLIDLGEFASALASFRQAFAIAPTPGARMWEGVALRRLGRRSEAIACLDAALSQEPDSPGAMIELAGCLEEQNDLSRATVIYEAVLRTPHDQSHEFAFNRLGICYERQQMMVQLSELLQTPAYASHCNHVYSLSDTLNWITKHRMSGMPAQLDAKIERLIDQNPYHEDIRPLFDAAAFGSLNGDVIGLEFQERLLWHLGRHAYGQSFLRLLSDDSGRDFVGRLETIPFLPNRVAIARICDRIRRCVPTSLIRLGDGEGNFLAAMTHPANNFLQTQNEKILRNWFGENSKNNLDYLRLMSDLQDAIAHADFLGIPNVARLEFERRHDLRGYWGVYFASHYAVDHAKPAAFISPVIHLSLFEDRDFVSSLRSASAIHTVSCHAGLGSHLRDALAVSEGQDFLVPGEAGISQLPDAAKHGDHFPQIYSDIMPKLMTLPPGGICLIAAGICGKCYANAIKQSGGIAIDIGAMADHLLGFRTREIFASPDFHGLTELISPRGR